MKKLLISLLVFLGLTTSVFADEIFEVPMGFNLGLSLNAGGYTGDTGEQLQPGGGLGINIGFRISMSFGLYLEGLANKVTPEDDMTDKNFDVTTIQGNLGLNFYIDPTSEFQPFITAGLGTHHLKMSYKGESEDLRDDSKDQQTVFIGAGIEYILSPNMTIPAKVQFTKMYTEDGKETYKDNIWNVVVGFNYYF